MITITNAILHAYKEVKKPIISMIIGTVIKLALSFILIGNRRINIYGAPISTFVSTTAIVCINIYFILKKSEKINSIYELFGKSFLSAIFSMTAGLLIYTLFDKLVTPKVLILITIMIVALLYFILVLFLRAVSKNDLLLLPKGELVVNFLTKIHLI